MSGALGPGPVGRTWDGGVCSWDSDRALLYAVGVGAGHDDLAFTTENTEGTPQQVLPTFPVVLSGNSESALSAIGDIPLSAVLHAEQAVTLTGPLPAAGSARMAGTLTYRLSGDRNPQHSDPATAARAGFPEPILHGLCTFGMTGRALLATACGGDVARFAGMSARFSKPVFPGQTLDVHIWTGDAQPRAAPALFRTYVGDAVVPDRGVLTLQPEENPS